MPNFVCCLQRLHFHTHLFPSQLVEVNLVPHLVVIKQEIVEFQSLPIQTFRPTLEDKLYQLNGSEITITVGSFDGQLHRLKTLIYRAFLTIHKGCFYTSAWKRYANAKTLICPRMPFLEKIHRQAPAFGLQIQTFALANLQSQTGFQTANTRFNLSGMRQVVPVLTH